MKKDQLKKIISTINKYCPEISAAERKEIKYLLSDMITEDNVPFKDFWNKYPKKQRKFVAEKIWKMLPQKDKLPAISYISTYVYLNSPYIHLPENYLHDKVWRDEEEKPRNKTLDDLFKE